MLTVALIGADGAGKTTIAKSLIESCSFPIKYLYMGVNIESSNVALPTSRLVHLWKVHKYKQSLRRSGAVIPKHVHLHGMEHRIDRRGKLGAIGRLLYRMTEESYRQVVASIYQLRGFVVLYDRHFLFDICPSPSNEKTRRFTDRVHSWVLKHVFPRPHLVILLDAPPEVLYARKQEVPEDYLRGVRESYLNKRHFVEHFVCVDTTQPIEAVLATVNELIHQHIEQRTVRDGRASLPIPVSPKAPPD